MFWYATLMHTHITAVFAFQKSWSLGLAAHILQPHWYEAVPHHPAPITVTKNNKQQKLGLFFPVTGKNNYCCSTF